MTDVSKMSKAAQHIINDLTREDALVENEDGDGWVLLDDSNYAGIYLGCIDGLNIDNLAFTHEEATLRRDNVCNALLAVCMADIVAGRDKRELWNDFRNKHPKARGRVLLDAVKDETGFSCGYYENLIDDANLENDELLKFTDSWIATIPVKRLTVQVWNGWMRGVWGVRIIAPPPTRAFIEWNSNEKTYWMSLSNNSRDFFEDTQTVEEYINALQDRLGDMIPDVSK